MIALPTTIVLVGMMGAGKTSVGRHLSNYWKVPFKDSDQEIEQAANLSIKEIFNLYGEQELANVERRVISRLLNEPPHVLATGEGAFINPETRALIKSKAVSIWLNVRLETLVERVSRRTHRPLIQQGLERQQLMDLISEREEIYAQADLRVDCGDNPTPETAKNISMIVKHYLDI